jgi:hypothetical protein
VAGGMGERVGLDFLGFQTCFSGLVAVFIEEKKMDKLVMPIVVGLMLMSWLSFFSVILA